MKALLPHTALLCLSLLLMGSGHYALGQSVSGRVYDDISQEALAGASVQVIPGEQGTVTDSAGMYKLSKLQPGRYTIKVSHAGYGEKIIPNIWVRNGKITTEDIPLSRDHTELREAIVRDKVNPVEIGRVSITEEQINRFAATYYDPARVVTNSPDLAIANDQNNRISVRGISPNYNVWRLHGVEIVNPNHLSNAGTFTDEAIATGGSVNIISAQMMGNSNFLYGAFPTQYGNTVGGLFDMQLRDGNSEERQYTAQASLIGLDYSAEGPFSKEGEASYLMNYRYSFTGLLTHMGVDFGGEAIGFQDLSLNVSLPLKGNAKLNVFATGGLNFNNFDAVSYEESEIQKDRSDIYFDGKMGAAGASLKHDFGNGYALHSLAISGSQNTREQNIYDSTQTIENRQLTDRINNIASLHSRFVNRIGKGSIRYGAMINQYQYLGSNLQRSFSIQQWLFNPHLSVKYPLLQRLEAEAGLNYMRTDAQRDALNPRLGLTWLAAENTEVYARAGAYSQLLNPYNYFYIFNSSAGDYITTNQNFDFQNSNRYSLGVSQEWLNWNINLEGFYYYYPNVNVMDSTAITTEAETKGLSLVINRNYANNWYLNTGGSLFSSTWQRGSEAFDNRYNTKFNLNLSTGKEWDFNKEEKQRALSVNARVIYQGGLQEPVYDQEEVLSPNPATSVITNNADFFRIDLRIQWTWSRADRTSSIALDLQNATNSQNESYRYLDSFTGQIEAQYQLGLIPILTYRVEF